MFIRKYRLERIEADIDGLEKAVQRSGTNESWPVVRLERRVKELELTLNAILKHLNADAVEVQGTPPHKKLAIKSSPEVAARGKK